MNYCGQGQNHQIVYTWNQYRHSACICPFALPTAICTFPTSEISLRKVWGAVAAPLVQVPADWSTRAKLPDRRPVVWGGSKELLLVHNGAKQWGCGCTALKCHGGKGGSSILCCMSKAVTCSPAEQRKQQSKAPPPLPLTRDSQTRPQRKHTSVHACSQGRSSSFPPGRSFPQRRRVSPWRI